MFALYQKQINKNKRIFGIIGNLWYEHIKLTTLRNQTTSSHGNGKCARDWISHCSISHVLKLWGRISVCDAMSNVESIAMMNFLLWCPFTLSWFYCSLPQALHTLIFCYLSRKYSCLFHSRFQTPHDLCIHFIPSCSLLGGGGSFRSFPLLPLCSLWVSILRFVMGSLILSSLPFILSCISSTHPPHWF